MRLKALTNWKGRLVKLTIFALILSIVSLAGWRWMNLAKTDLIPTAYAQQDILLERRISQVEQRFYYIESRLNRLESETRYPGTVPGATQRTNSELSILRGQFESLRAELDSLRGRVGELECGVLKLDERTLTPAARRMRRPDAAEPCRTDLDQPVRLSARQ